MNQNNYVRTSRKSPASEHATRYERLKRMSPRDMSKDDLEFYISSQLNSTSPINVFEISETTTVPNDLVIALLESRPHLREKWHVRKRKRGNSTRESQFNGART